MKNITLLLTLIFLSFTVNPVLASYSTSQTTFSTSAQQSQELNEKKGGFFEKIMAKRVAKKIKKAMNGLDGNDEGLVAILAYLTVIGFIAALILHSKDKTSLGSFHLAQVLGNIILGAIVGALSLVFSLIPFVGFIVSIALALAIFINWLFGLIAAFNGEEKHMPIGGKLFDEKLRSLFD